MKKILLLLSALGITTTSVSSVVACNSNHQVSEQEIYDKIKAIANQPIEYNDLFLVNYDVPDATEMIGKMFRRMQAYNDTSTNLINQLLTKLVYERVYNAIPNIEELYPDFTLYTKINLKKDVNEETENLIQNRKFTTNYIILFNLHPLDQIKKFAATNHEGEIIIRDNSNLGYFFQGLTSSVCAEYIIQNLDNEIFYFKQSQFIFDDQKRLDFYIDLYKNSGHIKPFASDNSKNSLNMFSIVDINYQDNGLPQDTVDQIQNNSSDRKKHLTTIEDYIKNCWLQGNHIKCLHFDELGLIDSFETSLNFEMSYTKTDIENNQKLNYVFGVYDGEKGGLSGFYNGALIFNLNLKAKFKNQTSQQTINEKIYVRIVKNPFS